MDLETHATLTTGVRTVTRNARQLISHLLAASGLLGSLCLVTACDDPFIMPPPPPPPFLEEGIEFDCAECHGNADNPAPPVSTTGESDTADTAVGAHQTHVRDGDIRLALECDECHIVPEPPGIAECNDDPPAEVDFGSLANAGGTDPDWHHESASCARTYCHGTSLGGGANTSPTWTVVDGTQAACGACHGNPPPAPHTPRPDCAGCHPDTADGDGAIRVANGKHIDGHVDVAEMSCSSCHGSEDNEAPPLSTSGTSDTAEIGIGAHQTHVNDGQFHTALDCEACHVVPGDFEDPGHIDGLPAEVTWGDLASEHGASPSWDRDEISCDGVYCHGATLGGGVGTTPAWTTLDGTQAQCGDCHGIAPPEPHFQGALCYVCHPSTVTPEYGILIDHHVNGDLDVVSMDCDGCHGSAANDAPPESVTGSSDTADVEVGAHQTHVNDGTLSRAFDCEVCHEVPTAVLDDGHLGSSPAEVLFEDLAMADGTSPTWDRATATCEDAYCHGGSLLGGTNTEPAWTQFDGTQAMCGTCHGVPPSAPHPAATACSTCHPDTIDESFVIDIDHHVNGVVELTGMACNACHGSAVNDAPPVSTSGSSDTGDVEVGAHQSHVTEGDLRAALACEDCHVVPVAYDDPGHVDTLPAEVEWGALATADGVSPAWDRTTATCEDAYCHGATLPRGSQTEPVWTTVDGTQAACGTCHGAPPPAPHLAMSDCHYCHSGTVDATGSIDVAGGLHIDGTMQVDVSGSCDICHGAPPDSGAHLVHFTGAPDEASYGGTGKTADVLPGGNGYGLDCGNCHPMDSDQHLNGVVNAGGGHAEVELSPTGAPAGSLRALHPATATYTPGGTVLTDAEGLGYTLGTCSNVYCHSTFTIETPSGVPEPGVDFAFAGYPIAYPAYTVTTDRVYAAPGWGDSLSCDGCHGFPPRTYSDDGVDAGAGDSHSYIAADGYESSHGWSHGADATPCAACHFQTVTDPGTRTRTSIPPAMDWSLYDPVPIADHGEHVDGEPDVLFTTDLVDSVGTDFDLAGASYDPATRTCLDVDCHYDQTEVAWGDPFRWYNIYECNVCHQM